MVQIGTPHISVDPIKIVEENPQPQSEEDFYQLLKQTFLDSCQEKPGPWRISRRDLRGLCVRHQIKFERIDEAVSNAWKRMTKEICHEDLIIPADYDFVAKLADIDDCTDVFYSIADCIFLKERVHILYLSSTPIAVMLRIAGR